MVRNSSPFALRVRIYFCQPLKSVVIRVRSFKLNIYVRAIAGDAKNQVHMEGYTVSNQCMALVRDGCLLPTLDAAELGFIRESSDKQYVPDVFYKVREYLSSNTRT